MNIRPDRSSLEHLFSNRVAYNWNRLEYEVKTMRSLHGFKQKIKSIPGPGEDVPVSQLITPLAKDPSPDSTNGAVMLLTTVMAFYCHVISQVNHLSKIVPELYCIP